MTGSWILLALALVLIAANAVFVAAETALVTVDRSAVEARAVDGGVYLRAARALQSLATYLSGAQFGITLTSLAVGLLAEPSLAQLLHAPLRAVGVGAGAVEPVSVAVAIATATVAQMVFGELVPKNIALARPTQTVAVVLWPLLVTARAARPFLTVLNRGANQLLLLAGITPVEELRSTRTADELVLIVRRSRTEGALPEEIAHLLERSLLFADKDAADVMTPRTRMHMIGERASVQDVIALARATGHSRFPVFGADSAVDDIRGVVHLKRALGVSPDARGRVAVADVMEQPVLVPATLGLDPLLERLQAHGLQLAVVVDEFGGTAGLVTFEDLVEELVGDLDDEQDVPLTPAVANADLSWTVSGLLRPDEVSDRTGIVVPDGGALYETVAGYVGATLGRVPAVGDVVTVPGATLRVVRMDRRRVDLLQLVAADATRAHRSGERQHHAVADGGIRC